MLISYLSDSKNGPTVGKQRKIIADAGFDPEKEFVGEDLEHLNFILREGEDDEIVIAHHKAFLSPRLTAAVCETAKRAGAKITVVDEGTFDPAKDEDFASLVALSGKRWKKHGRKSRRASPGRPVEYKRPSGEFLRALKLMWWNPRTKENKGGFGLGDVCEAASDALGYEVKRHHIQLWISPTRQKPDDGLAAIERETK